MRWQLSLWMKHSFQLQILSSGIISKTKSQVQRHRDIDMKVLEVKCGKLNIVIGKTLLGCGQFFEYLLCYYYCDHFITDISSLTWIRTRIQYLTYKVKSWQLEGGSLLFWVTHPSFPIPFWLRFCVCITSCYRYFIFKLYISKQMILKVGSLHLFVTDVLKLLL